MIICSFSDQKEERERELILSIFAMFFSENSDFDGLSELSRSNEKYRVLKKKFTRQKKIDILQALYFTYNWI